MSELNLPPAKLFRHRGYTGSDLEDQKKRERIYSELNAALDGQVWFSSLIEQNDPFDTHPYYVESSRAELRRAIRAYHRECGNYAGFAGEDMRWAPQAQGIAPSKIRKRLADPGSVSSQIKDASLEIRKQQYVTCFTETPENILMWSYYSSSHQSFCYEFSRRADAPMMAGGRVAPIKYLVERPQISSLDVFLWLITSGAKKRLQSPELQVSEEDDQRVTDAVVLAKSEEWKHEREWRSVLKPESGPGYHSMAPYELSGVIFGVNASDALIDFVKGVLGSRVKYQNAVIHNRIYALSIVDAEV